MSTFKFRDEAEQRAVQWAKASYRRDFKRRMRQTLGLLPMFRGARPHWRYRPYGSPWLNQMHLRAAHWYRREIVMRGHA